LVDFSASTAFISIGTIYVVALSVLGVQEDFKRVGVILAREHGQGIVQEFGEPLYNVLG